VDIAQNIADVQSLSPPSIQRISSVRRCAFAIIRPAVRTNDNRSARYHMTDSGSPAADRFAAIAGDTAVDRPGVRTRSTRDLDAIRRWAAAHDAEPATGEATMSGPATTAVNDGGAGIRFNFPGIGRFRPIGWDEWLGHFDAHRLMFVYEEQDADAVAIRADTLFRARGSRDGSDREDWFQAEHELRSRAGGAAPSVRYRIVKDTSRS
jgi:hypothetical protein